MRNKEQAISQLEERFSKSTIAVVTNYQGLTVANVTQLRRKLRESAIEYRVVKNTMARFAAERTGKGELQKVLEGPSAIAFGYGEVTGVAKALTDYMQSYKTPLVVKGGIMNTRFLTPGEITVLCKLPSREILVSMVVQKLHKPLLSFLSIPKTLIGRLAWALEARKQQLAGAQH